MKAALSTTMAINAALFLFGAIQHAGIALGSFSEPHIVPAAIVESFCGLFLACGAATVYVQPTRTIAWIANLAAIAGVLLGIVALALGRGPRTASNDLNHRIMLALASGSLLLLFFGRIKRQSSALS